MDDQRREDWEQITRSLGAGFLVRWELHDPEAVEEEVGDPGPAMRARTPEEREPELAWFG